MLGNGLHKGFLLIHRVVCHRVNMRNFGEVSVYRQPRHLSELVDIRFLRLKLLDIHVGRFYNISWDCAFLAALLEVVFDFLTVFNRLRFPNCFQHTADQKYCASNAHTKDRKSIRPANNQFDAARSPRAACARCSSPLDLPTAQSASHGFSARVHY